jgi:chemotaxis protein MotA
MDIATIGGLVAAYVLIMMGMKLPNLPAFIDIPSLQIVIGGTIAVIFVSHPLGKVLGVVGILKNAFLVKTLTPGATIKQLVGFAEQARREGILALEARSQEIDDDFLKKGIQLAVDGTEPDLIKDILSTEISFIEQRHKFGADMFELAGSLAPAFGMIGTLIGLILMLGNMSDPDSIGPNMAVALITTMYGSIMANTFCIPIAAKLKHYSNAEILVKELMLEGIMSLQSGDNPRIVEQKLTAFIEPGLRASVAAEQK